MRFSRQGEALRVRTPAKINLSLHIQGRRADGFHDLQTVMVSVGLTDTLLFAHAPTGDVSLRICSGAARQHPLPVDDRNLIIKAVRLLQQETGYSSGVDIALWKKIPSEAGMGGGSSDAAATLVALNRFWELGLSFPRLHELAAKLGSDINFFLDSFPAALCTGRGEAIEAIPLSRRLYAVVIKPPFGLSTGRVFQTWGTLQAENKDSAIESALPSSRILKVGGRTQRELKSLLGNDLERAARTMNPALQQLLARLNRLDVIGSGMTGSGSACFALCRSARQARVLAGRCRSWNTGKVFVVGSGV